MSDAPSSISAGLVSLEDAQARICGSVGPLSAETIPLDAAAGRVLAEDIAAPMDLPPFDNSAMDGYAVRSADVAGASAATPVALRLVSQAAAGGGPSALGAGECVRIFTGAQMPAGADAVVMQEDAEGGAGGAGFVRIMDGVKPWANVRLQGEDVKRGGGVILRGEPLGAGQVGLLGALGLNEVKAVRRPRIGVLATGSELVEAGRPLDAGKIYESNRAMLAVLLNAAGALPRVYPLVPDQLEATCEALGAALRDNDAVITSGGVSVGDWDLVKPAFAALGGRIELWRVAMRPGKPFAHGRWEDKHWFGLPGNPVSAWVGFLLLTRPAVRRLGGAARWDLPRTQGRLLESVCNRGDRRHFMRVQTDAEGGVRLAGGQGSHMLGTLSRADGLIDVPPRAAWAEGTPVSVWRWDLEVRGEEGSAGRVSGRK